MLSVAGKVPSEGHYNNTSEQESASERPISNVI